MAMTGEITLRGRVLAVGGLKEKVLAAHQANIYHLLIPRENKKEVAEIPAKIQRQMHFTFVHTMDQVIEAALLDGPLVEAENGNQNEPSQKELPEPRPLHKDERIAGLPAQPGDEPSRDETNEYDPSSLIIPPTDHITPDSSPHIRADDSSNS